MAGATKLACGAIFHAYHFELGLLDLEQVDNTELLFGKCLNLNLLTIFDIIGSAWG
jgi:hypothetical protein